ncbi:alpha-L-fucosidase [Dinghuibacter silviterrae]|uniref:alpha-L-fucosidase n=1 Tax=Dinghuibacter silviterrae TaxID=1539049 RepID=A0A4R8DIY9_9BACT|nr:alpha-L-fucosidase [Dinghuibacter silviterrae]TDW97527.1 alpha-L-fucosidase [Dinghuibacter silviterrae]
MLRKCLLYLAYLLPLGGLAQHIDPETIKDKMQWYQDAKLGIFIHWGVYSVNGVDESWSFYNNKIPYPIYMQQLKGFTAAHYDPQAWADLIKASGARYAVLTTKHHDGVALWDTKLSDLNVAKRTPAGRDVVGPFFKALRADGIRCGAYFSLLDWSQPDYPGFRKDSSRYRIEDDYPRWDRYRRFCQGQIVELMDRFHPDLVWFDGDWEHSPEEWEAEHIRHLILSRNPQTVINGRLQGYGDYATPEQNIPVSRPAYPWWELCYTSNNNWGYHPDDTNFKTPAEVISVFADVIYNGGNLLLDIGPRADGTIPDEETHLLKELGRWTNAHQEAIFGTLPGIPQGHFFGPSTLSKDSATLYLFLPSKTYGQVLVKGLSNNIQDIRVVGTGQHLTHKIVGKISWSAVPGLVYIDVPATVLDEYMTVLALRLDGPVRLYKGQGGY